MLTAYQVSFFKACLIFGRTLTKISMVNQNTNNPETLFKSHIDIKDTNIIVRCTLSPPLSKSAIVIVIGYCIIV